MQQYRALSKEQLIQTLSDLYATIASLLKNHKLLAKHAALPHQASARTMAESNADVLDRMRAQIREIEAELERRN